MLPHVAQRKHSFDGVEILTIAAGIVLVVAVAFLL